jgi:uncharacterized protein YyaL (SSP411 family)
MFLTPEGAAFFGGTYFPREGRTACPASLDLLPRVAAAYREQGPAIAEHGAHLREALASLEPGTPLEGALPVRAPALALEALKSSFDPAWGGFGLGEHARCIAIDRLGCGEKLAEKGVR